MSMYFSFFNFKDLDWEVCLRDIINYSWLMKMLVTKSTWNRNICLGGELKKIDQRVNTLINL